MPLLIFISVILEIINELSKVCHEETQKNANKYVVSENSSSKNLVNFQEKHPLEIAFWSKAAGYLTVTVNILMGNLWNFQDSFPKNSPQTAFCNQLSLENVVSQSIFLINVFIFNGTRSQGLTEAVTGYVLEKKAFFEISWNS